MYPVHVLLFRPNSPVYIEVKFLSQVIFVFFCLRDYMLMYANEVETKEK